MPLIEELPVTAGAHTRTSHGWAYVPDVGVDPSRAPIGASAPRNKRLAREAHRQPGGGDTTAREAKAIATNLADLEKENWKDAAPLPVPSGGITKTKGKVTPNVRRILTSGRTFKHWLDAEEAELQTIQQQNPAVNRNLNSAFASSTPAINKTATTTLAPRKAAATMPPPSLPPPSSTKPPTPQTPDAHIKPENPPPSSPQPTNPLLLSLIPKPPSSRVMSILISEPALSYHAARGGPPQHETAKRYFCGVCGYWGKLKCRKCGQRSCGRMECWKGHEEGCVVGW